MPVESEPGRKVGDDVGGGDALLVDLAGAMDVSLCGGKAVGLATLRKAGLAVPSAVCLTTRFSRRRSGS
jgi:hypothetical protein